MSEERVYDHGNFIEEEEEEIEIEEDIVYDENGMPIYQEDEDEMMEMRRIINEKILNKSLDNFDFIDLPSKEKEKKIKESKVKKLSIGEFNELIEKQIEESKPKRFISKRIADKKVLPEQVYNVTKRKREFNPKLPPYFFSDEYRNRTNNNNFELNLDAFPSLN
jgi:hypothetical protein